MALNDGDRVRLTIDRQPTGTVNGAEYEGRVLVDLDNGTSATFYARDVEPIESKTWPPGSIETK